MSEPKKFKKPSIKDVARRAEVSVTTVSHVVTGNRAYAPETERRVRQAIEDLSYVPSYAANGLRQRATRTIGVCANDPFDRSGRHVGSFPDRLWTGILEEADLHQYKVLHFPSSIRQSEDASEFINGQIDGLIIATVHYDRRPAQAARAGLPVVMVARTFGIPDQVGAVAVDEASIVDAGLRHLTGLGHRRIAYLAGPAYELHPTDFPPLSHDDVARGRFDAYLKGIARDLPEFAPVSAFTEDWEGGDVTELLAKWRSDHGVTAVFAGCDRLARRVLEAARTLGLRVPQDLSVLGIDDEQESALCDPSLSSIEVPIQVIGRQAVRMLLESINGAPASFTLLDIPVPEVAPRASTGPLPV